MAEGSTTVGSIVGYLKLDKADWDAKIAEAKAQAEELGRLHPDISVGVNTDRAIEELAAVEGIVRELGAQSATVDVDVRTSGNGTAGVAAASTAAAAASEALEQAQAETARTAAEMGASEDAAAESVTAVAAASTIAASSQTRMEAAQAQSAIAADRLALAQARLGELEATGSASATRLAAARLAVAQAAQGQSAATTRLAAAQTAETAAAEESAVAQRAAAAASSQTGTMAGWVATGVGALVAILPAATTAAVAYGAGLGGMAGAAVLAVVGANQAMERGTVVGEAYGSGLSGLKGDLDRLAGTAATEMLTSFQTAEQDVTANLPGLNTEVQGLSTAFGRAGDDIVDGAVRGLLILSPLMTTVERQVDSGAASFKAWASGTGFQQFAAQAAEDLPPVSAAIGSLVKGTVEFVSAMRPAGGIVLGVLQVTGEFLGVLTDMGPVLPAIAAGAGGAFLAFQAWKGVSAILTGVQTVTTTLSGAVTQLSAGQWGASASATAAAAATEAEGTAAAEAAAETTLLGTAVDFALGPVGLIVGGLGALAAITGVAMAATRQNTAATSDYSSALVQDNDAVGTATTKMAAQAIQHANVTKTAKQYGLSLSDLTGYVIGNSAATDKVNSALDGAKKKYEDAYVATIGYSNGTSAASEAAGKQFDAVKKLQQVLNENAEAVTKNKNSIDDANQATDQATNAIRSNASAYGMTTSAYKSAEDAASKQTAQTLAATQAMQFEDDAAGLLNNALTILNGGALTMAQAQTGMAAASNAVTDSMKQNGLAITGNSEAAVGNQQAIQQAVTAADQLANAQATATGSTAAGVQAYTDSKNALEAQLQAQGKLTPAVKAYIEQVFDVNNLKVTPTKMEVDDKAATDAIASLKADITTTPTGHTSKMDAEVAAARQNIANLKDDLKNVPASQRTTAEAEVAAAEAQLQALIAHINAVPKNFSVQGTVTTTERTVQGSTTIAKAHGGTIQAFAAGGESGTVSGSIGSATSDSLLTRLSLGEEVTSAYAASFPGVRPLVKALNSDPKGTMQSLGSQQAASPVGVTVVNKSGVALDDLIELHIEQHGRSRKLTLSGGRQAGGQ